MNILFHNKALKDYQSFHESDIKIFQKINQLLKNISVSPFLGMGKPEPLKHSLVGYWSRRITKEHRLVYKIKDDIIYVLQCKYHY